MNVPLLDLRDYIATGLEECCGEAEVTDRGFQFAGVLGKEAADLGITFRRLRYEITVRELPPF